ncbi:hypothetical protein [Mycobacterium sp. 236(2023)]|uniref:hypothetical protein n=1 Tax=Mycobacterium sp. 236(2023) TaxID=3038163 RepID=UPI0024150B8E|nr:hypothetical protein [Mycobacterium sp. 236(2023)]MDG4668615.1 hypothetical protein [Mycobacterium sp. 236(2023)]
MPRLTHSTYCAQHRYLKQVWVESQPSWVELRPGEQRELHDYYVPTQRFSDEELLEYRQKITALHPSLPQRAGRALKKLRAAHAAYEASVKARVAEPIVVGKGKKKRLSKDRVITVKSLVHPQPDIDRLAKAVLALAKELADADRANRSASEQPDDKSESHDVAA